MTSDELAAGAAPRHARRRGLDESTRWSLVLRAGGEPTEASREALDELFRAYRAPMLAFARRLEADPERAEDLVQSFFESVLERNVIGAARQERGSFRRFLRAALRHHAINRHRAAGAQRRFAPLADEDVESVPGGGPTPDRLYDQAWARALLDRALGRLADEQATAGKSALFAALRDRIDGDDDGATLRDVGATLGKKEGAMKVALFRLRCRFFDLVRAEVVETLARPDDVDAELSELRAAWR